MKRLSTKAQAWALGIWWASRKTLPANGLVIAGGGDSAVDWAVALSAVAEKIYVVHRREKFRAQPDSVNKLHALAETGKIELVIPYQLHGLKGDDGVLSAVEVQDFDGHVRTLDCDALLSFFGLRPELRPHCRMGTEPGPPHGERRPRHVSKQLARCFCRR